MYAATSEGCGCATMNSARRLRPLDVEEKLQDLDAAPRPGMKAAHPGRPGDADMGPLGRPGSLAGSRETRLACPAPGRGGVRSRSGLVLVFGSRLHDAKCLIYSSLCLH